MSKCLCTVLNKKFIPGFRALLNSIKMHTKGFAEEMVCINIDLTEEDKNLCRRVYPQCNFVEPNRDNYKQLPKHTPALKNAFFKLDIFDVAQKYDRTLFVDSDMVFLDSIQPLLDTPPPPQVGLVYHASHQEYNTGLILLGKIKPPLYQRMLALMRMMDEAHLADQTVIMKAIQRQFFSVVKLPTKWNTTKRYALQRKDQPRDYIGLHFVGKKPWMGGEKSYESIEAMWRKYA